VNPQPPNPKFKTLHPDTLHLYHSIFSPTLLNPRRLRRSRGAVWRGARLLAIATRPRRRRVWRACGGAPTWCGCTTSPQ